MNSRFSRTKDLKHHIETQYKAGNWEQYPPVEGSIPQFAVSARTSPQPASHKDQVYSCDQCGHEANVTVDLKKHKAEKHKNSAYTCNQCGLKDAGTAPLKKHKKQSYKDSAYSCGQCRVRPKVLMRKSSRRSRRSRMRRRKGAG